MQKGRPVRVPARVWHDQDAWVLLLLQIWWVAPAQPSLQLWESEEDPGASLSPVLRALHSSASPYFPHKLVMYCWCLHLRACPLQEEGGNCCFYCFFCLKFIFLGYEMSRLSSWSLHDSNFGELMMQQRAWGCKTFMHLLSSSGDLDIMRQLGGRNLQSYRFPWTEVSVRFVVSPHFWCTQCLVFVTMTALSNLVPSLFLKA